MSINFHIPDFTHNLALNLVLIQLMSERPELFYDDIKIGSVYGEFHTSVWNGGRIFGGKTDSTVIRETIRRFRELGIPLRFTFTNPMLKKEHLSDQFSNYCLEKASGGINEVIVFSPLLEEYIRGKYPEYPIISSTCKQLESVEELCAELERDYKYVVLDYNFNNRFDVLETLPHKEKCELLVNACCIPHCPRRGEHYRHLGEEEIKYWQHMKWTPKAPFRNNPFSCEHMNKMLFQIKDYSTHITPQAIYEKYVPMGFNNFKIEGRSVNVINLAETYIYYMVRPECAEEARFIILLTLQKQGAFNAQR